MFRNAAGACLLAFALVPLALSSTSTPAWAGSATSHRSKADFIAALGGHVTRETFDEFQDGVSINDQIPGLYFHSPGEGYSPTTALSTGEAKSAPIVLSGGTPTAITNPQVILVDFSDGLPVVARVGAGDTSRFE